MRTSAFGSSLRSASVRCAPTVARAPVVVRAVQDVQGTVVSTKMANTVVVAVERLAAHEKYFKRQRITKRFFAHTEDGSLAVGDYVRLEGTRPMSKNKRFAVAEVLRKAN
ncbi:hypothetical protein FOA52_010554 [Chlamydomonas sp. UWO 241]|nr:hypothetical protein FOA52_010554 [Chlamydomonas sp. UWO 241]